MNIDSKELLLWEIKQDRKIAEKFFEKKRKTKLPYEKKMYEKKRKQLGNRHFFKKEDVWVKKVIQKKFRRKWKEERNRGNWHRPVNREYHTYGWITW